MANARFKMDPRTLLQRRNPHVFTAELNSNGQIKSETYSSTIPDSILNTDSRLNRTGPKRTAARKTGLEVSVLSTIAEGDSDLVAEYQKLSINPSSGLKTLTPKIVEKAASKAVRNVDRLAELIKRAQNVSLCFLVDTTGSMGPYITGVKDQIVKIVTEIEASHCAISGLAFVGYKDWCDGENHFELLPFTTRVPYFKNFVAGIYAQGGGDIPEDVIGGLNQALKLNWPEASGSRILFHLADAPPHGRGLYHPHEDSYPSGHPKDRPLAELFREMQRKEVTYFFGRINKECEKMIKVFEQYRGGTIDVMDNSKVWTLTSRVTDSVMKTVTATCESTLSTIKISGSAIRKYILDEREPDWSRLPVVLATVVTYKLPESISDITSFENMEELAHKCPAQIAPNPFAKGSLRLAYYGRVLFSKQSGVNGSPVSFKIPSYKDNVVFKEMITLPKVPELDRQRYLADLEMQTVASKLAFEFNKRLSKTPKNPNLNLQFLMPKIIRFDEPGLPRFMAYENRFHGASPDMVKYTNNLDFVLNPGSLDEAARIRVEVAIAFSHFTHSITDGYLLVCDLQGITSRNKLGKPTLLLTDPAIHCAKHLRFGKTNLGGLGITRFFAKHKCNSFCAALGLKMPPNDD